MPAGLGEEIAAEALERALQALCRGGSWRGVARGLAWSVVTAGDRSAASIEALADTAEALLASLIDDALWSVEQAAVRAWQELLEARPGDTEGALAAARLDAAEESARLLEAASGRVVEALLARTRRAA